MIALTLALPLAAILLSKWFAAEDRPGFDEKAPLS
jgi:hypothetical protein